MKYKLIVVILAANLIWQNAAWSYQDASCFLRTRAFADRSEIERQIAGLRTGDEIMNEMYARHQDPDIFDKMGLTLLQILADDRQDDALSYLEELFSKFTEFNREKYSPSEINMFRFAWGEWFLNNDYPRLARLLLERDIPGDTFPASYRVMYYHLLGNAYRGEATMILAEGATGNEKALRYFRDASTNFSKARRFVAMELRRLKDLHFESDLAEKKRKGVLTWLGNVRRVTNDSCNAVNIRMLMIIGSLSIYEVYANYIPEIVVKSDIILENWQNDECPIGTIRNLQRVVSGIKRKLSEEHTLGIPDNFAELCVRVESAIQNKVQERTRQEILRSI